MHNGPQTSVIEESKPPSQQALVDLCVGLLPVWARHLASSRAQSETAVGEMLKAFADIEPHIDRGSRQQVERMYIGFQYQDRINQMMALLESDIARLQETLTGQGQNECVTDLISWLARLESEYAMAEQRHGHHGTESVATNTTNSFDDNEATFF